MSKPSLKDTHTCLVLLITSPFTQLVFVRGWMLSCFSHSQLFMTLQTIAPQVPLPMGFSRQEYWAALPCPPPGDLSDPEIKPRCPALQADFYQLSYHRMSITISFMKNDIISIVSWVPLFFPLSNWRYHVTEKVISNHTFQPEICWFLKNFWKEI